MSSEFSLFWYMITSASILMGFGFAWSRKGIINFLTKYSYIAIGMWGLYEIVRMLMR